MAAGLLHRLHWLKAITSREGLCGKSCVWFVQPGRCVADVYQSTVDLWSTMSMGVCPSSLWEVGVKGLIVLSGCVGGRRPLAEPSLSISAPRHVLLSNDINTTVRHCYCAVTNPSGAKENVNVRYCLGTASKCRCRHRRNLNVHGLIVINIVYSYKLYIF